MRLKDRLKYKDKYCTEFVLKQIDTVKKYFKIPNSKRVYTLFTWCRREYFLCEDKVYVICFDYEGDVYPYIPIIKSAYVITFNDKEILKFETVIPDDTTPRTTKHWGCIEVDATAKLYTKGDFLTWLDSPSRTTAEVSVIYRQAIKFLQNYKKNTFKTGRYLFYVKRDKDYVYTYFIYVYDLKTKTELKIYVDDYRNTNLPEKLNEIYVKDLSGKLSAYQILQCKKAFFEYCRGECAELTAPNFYALEFVKQCIQPIEIDRGWCVAKPFAGTFEFQNIWIDDELFYDGKPYFVMTEGNNEWLSTRACAIDFFKPEYKSREPYINGHYKSKFWELDKDTITRLVEFLKAAYDYRKNWEYVKAKKENNIEQMKKIQKNAPNLEYKTNWQRIISEYNQNFYGRDELPLDLPMPDYTKLIMD